MKNSEEIIVLMRFGEALKTVERAGWTLASINSERCESVAEHSYGSVISAILISQYLLGSGSDINIEKIAIMAAFHDIQESVTGDIARTAENMQDQDFLRKKEQLEKTTATRILQREFTDRFLNIWNEYIDGSTLEARVVRGADILDMVLHARQLELSSCDPRKLDQFYQSSMVIIESLKIGIITEIFNVLFKEHNESLRDFNIQNT